jgi:hypothetical protein
MVLDRLGEFEDIVLWNGGYDEDGYVVALEPGIGNGFNANNKTLIDVNSIPGYYAVIDVKTFGVSNFEHPFSTVGSAECREWSGPKMILAC